MPVRLRITLFFAIIVFAILSLVCTSIYYFSYINRQKNFNIRLTNRAVTTARLLVQSETFNSELIQKIDASTAVAMKDKTIQAYNYSDQRVYTYADNLADTIPVDKKIFEKVKEQQYVYFSINNKDAVAYKYIENSVHLIIVTAAYDEDGRSNLSQLRFILWACFIGGILIAVIVGYFFSASLLRPVRKIADELHDISAQNLARRIPTQKTKDEWSYLAHTMNELLDRLEESFETQRRFIANASHELSTPLTSVSSQLEVSLQKERTAQEYQRVMQSVLNDVQHLGKLTQTLLEFAKASGTAGGLEINLVRVDEILLRMPREMGKLNTQYFVHLSFGELPEDETGMLILGNEDLLFSAIKNIVLNACKYSPNHTANIHLSVKHNELIVKISDEGKGIPKDALQKIFQPFYRANDHQGESGFGLGLSLTSRIIKLHRGRINVESAETKGTIFYVHLPIAGMNK